MRLEYPEIYWHGPKERILSLDFSPDDETLITAGSIDSENNRTFMRQWEINYIKGFEMTIEEEKDSKFNKNVRYVTDLTGGHENTVNCVKFSPNGKYIASCGDDRAVIVWTRRSRPKEFGSEEQELAWCSFRIFKSHTSDVYDLAWSRDSNYLVSGSIDNTAIFWNVEKGKLIQRLEGHTHFIQGVTLDPCLKFIVTQSSDRTVRVWKKAKSKKKIEFYHFSTLKRLEYKIKPDKKEESKIDIEIEGDKNNSMFRIFQDENTLNSRLDWSPEGSFLLVPAGQYKESHENPFISVVYVYRRGNLTTPCLLIPTNNKPALCTKFCPKLFKADPNQENWFDLPYKMVFAIATTDAVLIYSTQSMVPTHIVSNIQGIIHYASLTDMAWNSTKYLGISSSDGYCSFLVFNENELGIELPEQDMSEELRTLMIKKEVILNKEMEKIIEEDKKAMIENNNNIIPGTQPNVLTNQQITTIVSGKKKIQPALVASLK